MDDPAQNAGGETWGRTAVAVGVGLICSVLIWVAAPYTNYLVGRVNISDSYLPPAAVFLTLILVLAVNPLLRMLAPPAALRRRQLAIVVAIQLAACMLPCQGLMGMLPYGLARVPPAVAANQELADAYAEMDLPPSLFPAPIGFGERTPASDGFLSELPSGASVPWDAWAAPAVAWGAFLLAGWAMMLGLGLIVTPQWRDGERLAFPLVAVQGALIDPPGRRGVVPTLFRRRAFWVGAGLVFLLHLLEGLQVYMPEAVPAVPLTWNLSELFADDPWRFIHPYMHTGRVFFAFVGIAYFMHGRIAFSLWFFLVAAGVWRALAPYAGVSDPVLKMDDNRLGALVIMAVFILWIGRERWREVLSAVASRGGSDARRRDRRSAWMLLAGLGGMVGWMCWVGTGLWWAVGLTGIAFVFVLVITRIVAETGFPFFRIYDNPLHIMKLLPTAALSPVSLWMGTVVFVLFGIGTRVNLAALATQGFALDRGTSPGGQSRLAVGLLVILLVGLGVTGWVHLDMSYSHGSSLDGQQTPVSSWGVESLTPAHRDVLEVRRGQLSEPNYNRLGQFGLGAAVAGLLYWACLVIPTWPLHPVGILMVDSYYGHVAWASVFVGWGAKVLLVRFGGSRLYNRARPLFLGLILGEVLAAVAWAATAAVRAGMGLPYETVQVLPF